MIQKLVYHLILLEFGARYRVLARFLFHKMGYQGFDNTFATIK